MTYYLDLIIKYLLPVLSVVVPMLALRTGWIYTREKNFQSRKSISEFAYSLYKNTDDLKFKKISQEYGIAALTKDNNLSSSQREILLGTNDPVNNIDNYSRCSKFISITNHAEIFGWSKKRYRLWIYRKTIELVSLGVYFSSGFLVAVPFLYNKLFSTHIIHNIDSLSVLQKNGAVFYLLFCGIFFGLKSLHTLSTIHIAEKLIKANR